MKALLPNNSPIPLTPQPRPDVLLANPAILTVTSLTSSLDEVLPQAPAPSPWPFRFAAAMTACTLFLVLFGGSVTTMGAGMAVKGWIDAEGHFMPLFPVAKWFRDPATFVEHTHRMIGMVVGLLSIATVVATWRAPLAGGRRLLARSATVVALVAICVQGAIGGTRVLENSQALAFLHGAVGQLVFAILWCTTVILAPTFQAAPKLVGQGARGLALSAAARGRAAVAIAYGQIVLGAWFRHGLRVSTEVAGADERAFPVFKFMLHGAGAFVVLFAVLFAAQGARRVWQAAGDQADTLRIWKRVEWFVMGTFLVQLLLGVGALGMLPMERTALPVVLTTTLHVLFGALTLSACATLWMWGVAAKPEGEHGEAAA